MVTHSQTGARARSWVSLPAEIRLKILETIARQKYPGWASFASVCKEWQSILEKANFRKMRLGLSCLDGVKHLTRPQKMGMIHHIYFNIELPTYTRRCCVKGRHSPPCNTDAIVYNGLRRLLYILSTWNPENELALEVNAYSPSDNKHWFKNIYLSSNDVEDVEDNEDTITHLQKTRLQLHDPRHGWVHGHQSRPPKESLKRLFRITQTDFWRFHIVQAVTSFVIRRQFRRCLCPEAIAFLVCSFRNLKHLSYEPWAPFNQPSGLSQHQAKTDQDLIRKFWYSFPRDLEKLIIFEDSYAFYDPSSDRPAHNIPASKFFKNKTLGSTFANRSLELQHLAISFMVDAEDVFEPCQPTWSWPHLESLALTSQSLGNDWRKYGKIETLLCRASVFVRKMPKLHTLVLWNGGKANACAFIYRVDRECASITWRGTWRLPLTRPVIESWQRTASELPCSEYSELRITTEDIQRIPHCHGDAIHYLQLPCQVIEPASLWQIRRETYI
ncbi:hypothetical protein F4777DRAFT_597829 [Nemania sp. FL0916]|nr:hypothetical protein F4777DRAFT_597829 [Nemania sp. FL0916]